MKLSVSTARNVQAFACDAFPCNPRPFARSLDELIDDNGTAAIQSDEAKALLWVLMAQAYGQMATIDLSAEWERLYDVNGLGSIVARSA